MSDAIACSPTASRRCSWPLLGLAGLVLAAGAVWCQAHPEDATAAAEAFETGRLEAMVRKYATL